MANDMYTVEDLKEFINHHLRFFRKITLLPILVIYLLTGIFQVGPDQEAVLLLFGKYEKTVGPGIHWYFPRPVGRRIKVKTTKVYRVEVGFRTVDIGPPAKYQDISKESLMLTGDENIIDLDFSVQYKIVNLRDYLFKVKNPGSTIISAAEASMRQVVGMFEIDESLTEGKSNIQILTKEKLQEILDIYGIGIQVLNVQLQDVQPPKPVLQAFKDVASAREDRIRYINEANGYANDVIPKARGQAKKAVNEALAYKERRIREANGDVARFLKLYENYKLGEEVTKTRLYLENLEKNLKNTDKVIIDSEVKSGVLNLIQGEVRANEKSN
ncbi:HflK protein [Propionigenium maris DSM 9537]|uniref:Protein HflK n=1 Tax=Propionigenium maris DSM 9537 TaxID=1123000 RepID=A0A9W6GKU8_9FUSO|nr:FtsH protease activity modulator HflK [Propionigenium maris]GLI56020.1 HflK protein [Propionigenium maris DSM 9537]